MNKLVFYAIILVFLTGCSIGPNPNPGERTVDSLLANKKYLEAKSKIDKKTKIYPWAQLRLAILFEVGAGVNKDLKEAIRLYTIVAKQWGDDSWSKGNMFGNPIFGNAGFYNQNKSALFAQYKLAEFYFDGKYVKKDILTSYLLIQNILSKSKEIKNFKGVYCCRYVIYDGALIETIQKKLNDIEGAMSLSQKKEAENLISTWTPQKNL